ncbi:MAG: LysR substrate-binding domain-containing protein [Reyranellaceae bacterium]
MTLDQLRIFVAVAEREHVTQAAAALNLTASATSSAIAALEARHEVKLFDRVGRRIELTEAGRAFLDEARAVLARAAQAESVLADLSGLARGALALAASQTISNWWLPPVMVEFRRRYPGISLSLRIGNTEEVARWVHEGSVDLGLIEGEIDDPALRVDAVAEDELVVVVAPDHDWAGRKWKRGAPTLAIATEARWILREKGSGTREAFEQALAAAAIKPASLDVMLELPSNDAVRAAVEAGGGATAISRRVVAASLRAGTLVQVPLALPRRRFAAIRHRERAPSRAQREFRALLRTAKD